MSKPACAACGLRFREGTIRPGSACVRAGCKGRVGYPLHMTGEIDRVVVTWENRNRSITGQAVRSENAGRSHVAHYQRGFARALLLARLEILERLEGEEKKIAPIDWPDEPRPFRGALLELLEAAREWRAFPTDASRARLELAIVTCGEA